MNTPNFFLPDMTVAQHPSTSPTTKGRCRACNHVISRNHATSHIMNECSEHMPGFLQTKNFGLPMGPGLLIKVAQVGALWTYWLFFTVPFESTFEDLDTFLRDYWLECCGHGSRFISEGDNPRVWPLESEKEEIAKTVSVTEVLFPTMTCKYEYDKSVFLLEVLALVERCPTQQISIVMENEPPKFPCIICRERSSCRCMVCSNHYCYNCNIGCCCGLDFMRPLFNSPRTCVCLYRGRDPSKPLPY